MATRSRAEKSHTPKHITEFYQIENDKLHGVITNIDMVKVVIKHKKELLDMALGF